MTCKGYRDLRAKENAWKEVAGQVNCEVEECTRRWKTIRDRYVRELRRSKRKKTGDAAKDVYTPSWCLFPVLSFLNDSVRHRQTYTNLEVASEVTVQTGVDATDFTDNSVSVGQQSDIDDPVLSPLTTTGSGSTSLTSSRQSSVEPQPTTRRESLKAPAKRKRSDDKSDQVDSLLMKSLSSLATPDKEEDEEDLFGRQTAMVLRRLCRRDRAQLKLRIQSLLVDAEFPPD